MAFARRKSEASLRSAERRQRENEAPRLIAKVPELESLKLEFDERRAGGSVVHVRRIVVESAPALFVITCAQKGCTGGGHDLTRDIMNALAHGDARFSGQSICDGQLGPSACGATLDYAGTATYHPAAG